ncbi:MAG TPA: HNH endonuclease signature motif containing protein [Terricaulis sp.]|nr:HNH endonuclease signature motif containing protein [Terricaulis sp.]
MKGRYIPYSVEEMAWLKANRKMVISEYAAAFNARFGRDVSPKNLHALRKRQGWKTGRTGCFPKGNAPYNKGKPHPARGRSAETQFKPGVRQGAASKLYKPIGTERLCKDGYLERKVHDGMPLRSRWRAVHLIRWEEINGPVPDGHCLKCLDGNRLNTDPENWLLIPRALLPRLVPGKHGQGIDYDAAPAELKPAILATAKLKHAARTKKVSA